jgi:hypothetical protein
MENQSDSDARAFRHGASENSDTIFDFDTQGIDMYVDEDWVELEELHLSR